MAAIRPFGTKKAAKKTIPPRTSGPIVSPLGLSSVRGIRGWNVEPVSELDAWTRSQEQMYPGIKFDRIRYDFNAMEDGWKKVENG